MDVPVFITGTGLITVQGRDVDSNWNNLVAGRVLHETGIAPLARDPRLPRVSQLAIHAAEEALAAAGSPGLNDGRTALVVGTSKGPIEDWIDQLNGVRRPDVTLGVARVVADVAVALRHVCGPRLTLSGACASGLHALIRARDLIESGGCDHALVVAAEASTHALFRANFQRLGVLADPAEGCRPYDARRRGFLLAEGAAAVWLTRASTTAAVQVERGIALADATHLTAPDPLGRSLRKVLSGLDGEAIEVIHGHGTGTLQNDAVELQALQSTFRRQSSTLYSHKHAIGHTQGAAGLIATVLNVQMHRRQMTLGNANSDRPATAELDPRDKPGYVLTPTQAERSPIARSIVLAAGFGGTIAAVRLAHVTLVEDAHPMISGNEQLLT